MSLDKNNFELSKKVKNIHEVLINACLDGDQKAQFKIYKLYYKAMYNTSYRILKNVMDAEDVMQEAFLDTFQKIHQYDETATFGVWLKRIVINKSLDKYRKLENYIPFDEVKENIVDSVEEDYFEVLSMKIDEIRNSLERLTDAYRIILSLHLLEGYDHQEIAQILGISYGATRTKYARAKQQLLVNIKQFRLSKAVNLN